MTTARQPLRYALKGHVVAEPVERGWERLVNGALLDTAKTAGFEVFVTADKNMQYQPNLTGRKIAIVELANAQWPVLRGYVERVAEAGLCGLRKPREFERRGVMEQFDVTREQLEAALEFAVQSVSLDSLDREWLNIQESA